MTSTSTTSAMTRAGRSALACLLFAVASPLASSQEPPSTAPEPERPAVKLPPVATAVPDSDDELARFHAELEAPPTNDERTKRLVELFHQAGAPDGGVAIVPLSAGLEKRVAETVTRLRARVEKAGGTPTEVAASEAAYRRRISPPAGNVLARLPGRSGRVLIVAAHLDRADGTAGIVDDWAGCVLLARLYGMLRHSIWFVAFARHEDGALGAADFADQLDAAQLAKIDAAITVEAMGVSAPYVWWNGSDRGLVEIAADAARATRLRLRALSFEGGASDGLELARKNVPVLTLLGVEPAGFRILHGPEDQASVIDPARCAEMRNLLVALVEACDVHARPLHWDYVSDKLRIGDLPGKRKPLSPVPADLAAVAAPVPAPTAGSSPKDGSHRP